MNKNRKNSGLLGVLKVRRCSASVVALALTATFAFASPLVRAQSDGRSGKDVVESICAACHATGVDGAPRIGDTQAWSGRAAQGLSSLTEHAISGLRKMPAHGGRSSLSDLEIARAVTYMVNASGGNWVEPASKQQLAARRSGEQVVKSVCANCHGEGVGGAPLVGDIQAWTLRIKQGLDSVVYSAIRGHGGMPARGGMADLSDTELRDAILYMYNPQAVAAKRPPSVARAMPGVDDPNHKHADGMSIHIGFVAAQNLLALPPRSPERLMHGGVPKGSGYYHINVALFDAYTKAPISDAQVYAQFRQPGLSRDEIELEPMTISTGNYGNYVKPQLRSRYLITCRIVRPQALRDVEVTFEHVFE